MPPLPAAPAALKVVLSGVYGPHGWANVLHFAFGGTSPSDASCNTIASEIATAWTVDLAGIFPATCVLEEVTVQDLTSSVAGAGAFADSSPGTAVGATMPGQVCALIKHTIARRYRGGHPRTYLPAPAGGFLTLPDQVSSGGATAITNNWNSFITAVLGITTGGIVFTNPISLSYFSGGALRSVPVQDIILGSNCEIPLATQRRRIGR